MQEFFQKNYLPAAAALFCRWCTHYLVPERMSSAMHYGSLIGLEWVFAVELDCCVREEFGNVGWDDRNLQLDQIACRSLAERHNWRSC